HLLFDNLGRVRRSCGPRAAAYLPLRRCGNAPRGTAKVMIPDVHRRERFVEGSCIGLFFWRVGSWLRTNAGGVPNTCRPSEDSPAGLSRPADVGVTREQPVTVRGITRGNSG